MSTHPFASSRLSRHPFSESQEVDSLPAPSAAGYDRPDSILLGESAVVRRLRSQVQRIAPYFRTALLRGEIGSGKQLVARAIHALSVGAEGPFMVSNATALAEAIAAEAFSPLAASLL